MESMAAACPRPGSSAMPRSDPARGILRIESRYPRTETETVVTSRTKIRSSTRTSQQGDVELYPYHGLQPPRKNTRGKCQCGHRRMHKHGHVKQCTCCPHTKGGSHRGFWGGPSVPLPQPRGKSTARSINRCMHLFVFPQRAAGAFLLPEIESQRRLRLARGDDRR